MAATLDQQFVHDERILMDRHFHSIRDRAGSLPPHPRGQRVESPDGSSA